MHVAMNYGRLQSEFDVAVHSILPLRRQSPPPNLGDPASAVRDALETPFHYPALRQALTPDDHVVVVLDEHLPQLSTLLTSLLEHLSLARIEPEAITLLCQPPATAQSWLDDLPEAFESVRVEVHDPHDRDHLSYLATTRRGRRIYLNRSAIDADQAIVLGRRGYDPLTGYGGAEAALFPALADEATRKEALSQLSLNAPGAAPWPLRREAGEVAWLLGAPFFVQVIEGTADGVSQVIAGTLESSADGIRLLDAAWRVEAEERADVVVAALAGDPARHDFDRLAQALANATRLVKPEGRIVLLTDAAPVLGPAAQLLRDAGDSRRALSRLATESIAEQAAALQWASAAARATVYLLSRFSSEQAEDLLTVPLENAGQAQRLLSAGGTCVFLPEADKIMAEVADGK